MLYESHNNLHPNDAELVRDVFWDLFRQGGVITLGFDSNPAWPWFRLSYFGEKILKNGDSYRFHETTSFIALIKSQVPDVLPETINYLEEAVSAFYAGCFLAASVMLGVRIYPSCHRCNVLASIWRSFPIH